MAGSRESAEATLAALRAEPRASTNLWDDSESLWIQEVPMVSTATDIAAFVLSQVHPDADEILAERAAAKAAEQAEREAKQHRAQGTPVNEQGFGWWPLQ